MYSKLWQAVCLSARANLATPRGRLLQFARQMGLIPPSQYDVPIPKKLQFGYVIKEYWETIPLFSVTALSCAFCVLSTIWAFGNKVDVEYVTHKRHCISRTMDLRHPTCHKLITINQRYEPWPEMQDVLDKMRQSEKRLRARGEECPAAT